MTGFDCLSKRSSLLINSQVYFYRPQRSCGKVMFSQASVILFMGGVWQTPPGQTPIPGQTPPPGRQPPADDYCSGRYASYWNAFLYCLCRLSVPITKINVLFLDAIHAFVQPSRQVAVTKMVCGTSGQNKEEDYKRAHNNNTSAKT